MYISKSLYKIVYIDRSTFFCLSRNLNLTNSSPFHTSQTASGIAYYLCTAERKGRSVRNKKVRISNGTGQRVLSVSWLRKAVKVKSEIASGGRYASLSSGGWKCCKGVVLRKWSSHQWRKLRNVATKGTKHHARTQRAGTQSGSWRLQH